MFDGPNILLKLHVHLFNILRDIAIFICGPFGLKLPIHAHFGGVLGMTDSPWNLVPAQGVKKLQCWGYQMVENVLRFDTIPACDRQPASHLSVASTALASVMRVKSGFS